MKRFIKVLLVISMLFISIGPVQATFIDLGSPNDTIDINGTRYYQYSYDGLLASIGAVKIVDVVDGPPATGGEGVFTGADIDAIFLAQGLDSSGTILGGVFANDYLFQAGIAYDSQRSDQMRPSWSATPLFGALSSTAIDASVATLNSIDAIANASLTGFPPFIPPASGFLSLGDGGTLIGNFTPPVSTTSLFIGVGEVGANEAFDVYASSTPVPLPTTIILLGTGLIGLIGIRKRKGAK
jgi:hypothetical protein